MSLITAWNGTFSAFTSAKDAADHEASPYIGQRLFLASPTLALLACCTDRISSRMRCPMSPCPPRPTATSARRSASRAPRPSLYKPGHPCREPVLRAARTLSFFPVTCKIVCQSVPCHEASHGRIELQVGSGWHPCRHDMLPSLYAQNRGWMLGA